MILQGQHSINKYVYNIWIRQLELPWSEIKIEDGNKGCPPAERNNNNNSDKR